MDEGNKQWAQVALISSGVHPTGIPSVQAFFRTMIAEARRYGFGRPDFNDEEEKTTFFELAKGFMIASGTCSRLSYNQDATLVKKSQKWDKMMKGNSRYAAYLQLFLNTVPDNPTPKSDSELFEPFTKCTNQYGDLQWPFKKENETVTDSTSHAVRYTYYLF